ncbi:brain and acute leukemia cytoplasmic protein isoform X2 [Pangasianodon hypophthalmus]|uniref:brain and acute leukemia cytoplasmic protein isoform X2 n=1 Tax=Pangasianodon hypophthalmus TaxID=310915 RepID=UPI000EFE86DB|nr:brain and acute leukemia cytoplasmic protein isoform X2 [Pangasianodon hypophthalmus]
MGCGGSRSDAIEPRRHESWTRETESTWLTSTDAEGPNNSISKGVEARSSLSSKDKRMVNTGIQCGKPPLTSSTCTNQQRSQQMKLESVQESDCSLK